MSLLLTVIGAGMGVGAAGFSRSRRSKAAAKRLGRAVRRTDQAPESRAPRRGGRPGGRDPGGGPKRRVTQIVGRPRPAPLAPRSGGAAPPRSW
jgi:hypothetical protein